MHRTEPVSREIRTAEAVREDAGRYLRARLILNDLREKHMAGDIDGAVKGLARVLRQNEAERMGMV